MTTCPELDDKEEAACIAVNYVNVVLYLLLIVVSAHFLILAVRGPERNRKWQIVFHSFIIAGCVGTGIWLELLPIVH